MRKRHFALAALAVGILAGMASCSLLFPSIEGYWKSSFEDGFEVKDDLFYQYDDAAKSVSFAGTIVSSSARYLPEGYLTVKITDAGTWMKTVGEFLVVRWKNFDKDTVEESTPYKPGGESTMPTAAAAEAEFTVANGYYGFYPTYARQ